MESGKACNLLRSHGGDDGEAESKGSDEPLALTKPELFAPLIEHVGIQDGLELVGHEDRKSTRLNSSHSQISYAVFCLKKKKYSILFGLLVNMALRQECAIASTLMLRF